MNVQTPTPGSQNESSRTISLGVGSLRVGSHRHRSSRYGKVAIVAQVPQAGAGGGLSSPARIPAGDQRRAGDAPAVRGVPRLQSRCHQTPRTPPKCSDRCCGTILNFERGVLHGPARYLRDHSRGAHRRGKIPFAAWRETSAPMPWLFGTVQKTDANTVRVQVRLYNVRSRQSVFCEGIQWASAAKPASLRPHHLRTRIQSASNAHCGEGGAHEADLLVRPQPRKDSQGRSRTGTSRRSTSPITTVRTSGA